MLVNFDKQLYDKIGKNPRMITVIGRSGFGKSFFIQNYIVPQYKNIIALDTQNEYNKGFSCIKNLELFYKQLGYYKIMRKNFKISLKFDNVSDYNKALDYLDKAQNFTLLLDEGNIFANNKQIHKTIDNIVNIGRHRGVNLIFAARRLYQTNIIVRSQTNLFIFFNIIEESDLKYVKSISDKDTAEKVKNLEKYQYIYKEY